MAIGDIPAGYWIGPYVKGSPSSDASKISKTAWMDLYYDLYMQTHGEDVTSPETVIADAKNRLRILKANGIRR
jgi:hypothetical protein